MVFLGFSFVFFCFSYWPKALLQLVELTLFNGGVRGVSFSPYLTGESEEVFVFLRSVKAGASFVGEITMTSYLSRWIAQLEMPEKSEKSRLLCVSPCILRIALCVKTTLVANANAILIPSAAMSTDLCFAPAFLYRSVTSYHM